MLKRDCALAVAIVMRKEKAERLIFWSALTEQLFYSVYVPIQLFYSVSCVVVSGLTSAGSAGNLQLHFIFTLR